MKALNSKLNLRFDTPINLDVSGFWRWWRRELGAMAPAWVKTLVGTGRPELILSRDGETLAVKAIPGDGSEPQTLQFPIEQSAEQRQALIDANKSFETARIVFSLAPETVLRRDVWLPAAVAENLHQAVGFDLDRLTPFKTEQVEYGTRLIEKLTETGQIRVELVLTPRPTIESLIQELAAWGWHPDAVDTPHQEQPERLAGYNLLPARLRPAPNPWPLRINIALGVTAALLFGALFAIPSLQHEAILDTLEQRQRSLAKTAKEVEQLRLEAESLEKQSNFLIEKKRGTPTVLQVLNELTKRVPDSTWLLNLQYKDGRLLIQGESTSASELIALLEASDTFRDTAFVSPVTKDAANNRERFQISTRVATATPPNSSPDESDEYAPQ